MRLLDLISARLAACLILGILLGYWLKPSIWEIFLPLAMVLLAMAGLRGKRRRMAFPLFDGSTLLAALLLGALAISLSLPTNQSRHYLNLQPVKKHLVLKIEEVLKPNRFSQRYYASVTHIDTAHATGKVLLDIRNNALSKPLYVDDELVAIAKVDSISGPLNPHQFDYRDYLKKQGVYGQVRISNDQFLLLPQPTRTLRGTASNFRDGLLQKLQKQGFGINELGVLQALLVGQRNAISDALYDDYKNAGAVHILAVSGLHVGILLLLLQLALKPLRLLPKGPQVVPWTVIFLLWTFAFVAGLSPSIVRAVTMFSFVTYALYLNRPTNAFNILALSLFFILLVHPLFVFQVGFQMSYAAVFSIVWIYPKLQRLWYPKNWLIRKVWQLLSVSVAAQLGVLPISLYYFHQFPSLFFVSNLLVVPFLGIILGLGFLVLLLTHWNALPPFLVWCYNALIKSMNTVVAWVGQQEDFVFKDIPFDGVQLLLAYALTIGTVLYLSKRTFNRLAWTLGSYLFLSTYSFWDHWQKKDVERLWLLHQTKNSVVLYQKRSALGVLSDNFPLAERYVKNYAIAQRVSTIQYDSLKNAYTVFGKKLLILDKSGIYGTITDPDMALLTQSPPIHLGKFLEAVRPKSVFADGSNYKSYVSRWRQSCREQNIPFYYTGEKGAYFLNWENRD